MLAAPRVPGEDVEVAAAALEALPVVDAVDHEEGVGPAQVALAVPGAILGARGAGEHRPRVGTRRAARPLTWSAVSITFSSTGCWSTSSSEV